MSGQLLKVAASTIGLGAAWLVGAGAQDKSPAERKAADKPAMQVPGPEMERLKFLLGTWDVNAEYLKSPMMPEGGKETGWYKAQLGPGGFSILADFEQDGPMGQETGHQILSRGPETTCVHGVHRGERLSWDGDGHFAMGWGKPGDRNAV